MAIINTGGIMDQVVSPFYADLKFWSFVLSVIALLLSQGRTLWNAVRRPRVSAEVFSQAHVTHKFGNPNLQLHLVLSNIGGRKAQVRGITLKIVPANGEEFTINSQTYQKEDNSLNLLFTPISLKPGETWANMVNFWKMLPRQEENRIRQAMHALQEDVIKKRKQLIDAGDNDTYAIADEALVAPFTQLYARQFKWKPDEYTITLSMDTEPPNVFAEEKLRFVLFDWETEHLQRIVGEYEKGFGVYLQPSFNEGINVPIEKKT
jgi:hypothetical protein